MKLKLITAWWDVTELVTLNELYVWFETEGLDARVENGRVLIPVFKEEWLEEVP